jgi:hypothetical protein
MNEAYLRQLIGDVHVGESYRTVLRHVLTRVTGDYSFRRYRQIPRVTRLRLLRQVRKIHTANRKMYVAVMSGTLGSAGKPRRARRRQDARPG